MQPGRSARGRHRRRRLRYAAAALAAATLAAPAAFVGFERWAPGTGLPMAVATALVLLWAGVERSARSTWLAGARGEVATAAALRRLPGPFCVLHDRALPPGRGNLDHLVVGPTGVFAIETKLVAGIVRARWGSLRVDRVRRPDMTEQALRQAELAARAIGVPVRPVLCLHASRVFRRARTIDGVVVCGPGRLIRVLRRGPRVLSRRDARALARVAASRLPEHRRRPTAAS